VKTVPFFYRDGTMGLPIYPELFAKYGEILHRDRRGNVIEKLRLNDRWRTLQPLVLFNSKDQALALMRYSDQQRPRQAIQVVTQDGGQHWSEPIRSMLPNPDSAIAGIALGQGRMMVVINNNSVQRDDLTLMYSEDGGHAWQQVFRFEDQGAFRHSKINSRQFTQCIVRLFRNSDPDFKINKQRIDQIRKVMCRKNRCFFQFDYPYLIQSSDGHFHLLYSWNRTYIKQIEFNRAWLEDRLKDIKA
ncbi:MAG: exo-alpha-sialidase, partial [Methylococcales bacterium]